MGKRKQEKHKYDVFSDQECATNGHDVMLKQNVIDRHPNNVDAICYKCHCKQNKKNPRARKENRLNGTRRIDKGKQVEVTEDQDQ